MYGTQNRTSLVFVLYGLVRTPPSMAANLPCLPGSSLSPEVLTSFVPPIHNQGVSLAPRQGHALWKIFLLTNGSFLYILITDFASSFLHQHCYQRTLSDTFCSLLAVLSQPPHCYFVVSSGCLWHVYCRSSDITEHLVRIIVHTLRQHCVEDSYQLTCYSHQ